MLARSANARTDRIECSRVNGVASTLPHIYTYINKVYKPFKRRKKKKKQKNERRAHCKRQKDK